MTGRHFTLATHEEIETYRLAPSGKGPHAGDWADKPHRLVYDLCTKAEDLLDEIVMLRHDLARALAAAAPPLAQAQHTDEDDRH